MAAVKWNLLQGRRFIVNGGGGGAISKQASPTTMLLQQQASQRGAKSAEGEGERCYVHYINFYHLLALAVKQ